MPFHLPHIRPIRRGPIIAAGIAAILLLGVAAFNAPVFDETSQQSASLQVASGHGFTPLQGIPEASGGTDPDESFAGFIQAAFELSVIAAGMLAVLVLTIAGFQYMTSDAFTDKENAKKRIWNAIVGLLIVLGSYMLLYQINPNLVNLNVFTGSAPEDAPPSEPINPDPDENGDGENDSGDGNLSADDFPLRTNEAIDNPTILDTAQEVCEDEVGGILSTNRQTVECLADADNDNVPDNSDNCPQISNTAQVDVDGDGRGLACDSNVTGEGSAFCDGCEVISEKEGSYNPGRYLYSYTGDPGSDGLNTAINACENDYGGDWRNSDCVLAEYNLPDTQPGDEATDALTAAGIDVTQPDNIGSMQSSVVDTVTTVASSCNTDIGDCRYQVTEGAGNSVRGIADGELVQHVTTQLRENGALQPGEGMTVGETYTVDANTIGSGDPAAEVSFRLYESEPDVGLEIIHSE